MENWEVMTKQKIKFHLCTVFLALAMLLCPLMSGCSFSLSCLGALKLDTPEITLHSSSKCLSWSAISSAKCYQVYCNDEYVEDVNTEAGLDSYVYDFSSSVSATGDYEFYIIAKGNPTFNEDSDKSNTVVYTCGEIASPPSAIYDTIIQTANTGVSDISYVVNGTKVQFIPYDDNEWEVDGYELYMYSNSTGLKVYPISLDTPTSADGYEVNLLSSQYSLKDEIYAIRIGVVVGDEHYVASDIQYVNPDSHYPYTKDIYIFDGYINDCYIESIDELRNLVYYNFVYRITAQNIKLSPAVADLIASYSSSSGTDMASRVQAAVADAFDYFFETRDEYILSVATLESVTHQYCIKVGYNSVDLLNSKGKTEPDTGLIPPGYVYEDIDWEPYYNTCGYTMRNKDSKYALKAYDNFASDQHFLYTDVSTSEELYWAVENNITPVCKSGSTAMSIYKTAKSVLNSIISDNMTDYEKALCIFDWINDNTSYDYYSLVDGCYENAAGTITPAYYLEGVFNTGYAVCDGFSKAYSLLCNMEGIECVRIVGYAGTSQLGGHAWNKVLIDIDPTDEIGAEYYLVDITWTELKGSTYFENFSMTGEEVTSHEYFLTTDEYVEDTHYPFSKREKFAYYQTASSFDYYANSKYVFNGRDYGLLTNSSTNVYDGKIESDEDLEVMFRYMLVNNLEAMEVLVTYDYISEVYNASNEGDWYDALVEKMRSKKFIEQYIFINTTGILNSKTGIILVLENNLLIDADNEVGHLVDYMSHYQVYGDYDLYITETMLNKALSGTDALSKAQSLFASALNTHNINIAFTYVDATTDSKGEVQAHYTIKITAKTN